MTKYDDDIREAESRLIRDRRALVAQAEDLGAKARDVASSPKGLFAAFAVGFILGELTAPRRPKKSRPEVAQAADTTKKMGLGGLIGSALFAYARSRYGSPWAMGHSAWNYYAAIRQARRSAATRAPSATVAAAGSAAPPSAAPSAPAHASSPRPAYSTPVRSPESHAAG
jgi:hypothetical protein